MGMSGGGNRAVPYINVTPLIDVLLVLLIIFMVVTPLKPSRFKREHSESKAESAYFGGVHLHGFASKAESGRNGFS